MHIISILLLILILISLCGGFYAVVKQQGRILLRLDQLEQNPPEAVAAPESHVEQAEPDGLPLGTSFPAFKLPDLAGRTTMLEDYRGKRVLLLHWDFECGFCESLAADLAALETGLDKANVALVLLAYGDLAANQKGAAEHGLKYPILLMKDGEKPQPFEHRGTPVAYLLDEEGRVDAPFAVGADRVLSLAKALAGSGAEDTPAGRPAPTAAAPAESRSPLGTQFPAFQLPDLAGETVALSDLRGGRVLLVHWNFDCGFCAEIAPALAGLKPDLEEKNVRMVLLAKGDARFNKERAAALGLTYRILLLQDHPRPQPFAQRGTPVAYLVDEEGRFAAPFASGRDQVLSLARALAGGSAGTSGEFAGRLGLGAETESPEGRSALPLPHPESKIENPQDSGTPVMPAQLSAPQATKPHRVKLPGFLVRGEIGLGDVIKRMTAAVGIKPCVGCERRAALLNRWMSFSGTTGNGLKAGERAPLFRLPDLQGRIIALEEYHGRRVLLVFTDPQCGPCDELAPDLARIHAEPSKNDLAIIIVGRGNAEENRRKAEQHGIRFPVVIQPKWKLSKEYGTYATPVGFLIGEDGLIAKDVAVGRGPILTLVQTAASALTRNV